MSLTIGTIVEHCKTFGWGPGYRRGVVCEPPPGTDPNNTGNGTFVRWMTGGVNVFPDDNKLLVVDVIELLAEVSQDQL